MALMEKKMDTAIVYWSFVGILEQKMEATVEGLGVKGLESGFGVSG